MSLSALSAATLSVVAHDDGGRHCDVTFPNGLRDGYCQIQLDCPSARHSAYASIFAIDAGFKSVTSFGLLIEKYHTRGMFFGFFVKPQNGLVWPVFAFFFVIVFCRNIES